MRAVVVVAVLCVGSLAFATQDFYRVSVRVAAWGSGSADPVVVEMTSFSPEAGGQNTNVWWSIQQPAGTEQARINAPYTRPTIWTRSKSTVTRDSLEPLRARLAELATQKPAIKAAVAWTTIAAEHGLVALKGERCPKDVRMKIGAKRLILWSGTQEHDLGSSKVKTAECDEISYSSDGGSPTPDMRIECFPHGGALLVRVRLHHGCGGDSYYDQFAFVPVP